MRTRGLAGAAAAAFCLFASCAQAAPFTPASDSEVVERLPVASDPALRAVESLRRQLASRPADARLRLDIAERYFALAMAQGDPRYVGYARSTIAPLEKDAAADTRYWLVRGQLQQYGHDFAGALASLKRASAYFASTMWIAARQATGSTASGDSSLARFRLASAPSKSWPYCCSWPRTSQ